MSLEVDNQLPGSRQHGRFEIFSMFMLASLIIATLLISFFLGGEADTYPSATRIVLRINHNITSAHHCTHEYFNGGRAHSLEDIDMFYERASDYVKVALAGGEIDGVMIVPLRSPELYSEMEKIGNLIGLQRKTSVDFLSPETTPELAAEFGQQLDEQYLDLVSSAMHFTSTSRNFLQRHQERFEVVQLVLMILAVIFVLAILSNSRKVRKEKATALGLVKIVEERKQLAIEGANLGTWDWNIVTGETVFNQRWLEMLGLDTETVEPSFDTWKKLVHPDDFPTVLKELEANLSGKSPRLFCEYRMWAEPGHWIWVLDLGKVLERDTEGKPLRAAGTLLDITELKTAELKLRVESVRAQQYLDLAGVLFVALDKNGIVTMVNRKACQVLGVPEDYVIGRNWFNTFVPERIREEIVEVSEDLLGDNSEHSEYFINPIMTASGSEALIAWSNETLHDDEGNLIGHLSSGTDITRQRAHEVALERNQRRLRSLASQLAMAEDRLRQDIASGLHDSIGQNLAALKLSIDLIGLNLDNLDTQAVRKDLNKASETIDKIVRETWSLSFQLSPPGLHETGICSALEWLVSRYNEKYSCKFVLSPLDSPVPREKDGRGLLFQMIRELMLNAIKHSSATKVEISLSGAGQFILATVSDNGSGFDTTAALAGEGNIGGFGLFSIRERLAYISGELEIDSTIGEGTRVIIRFPMAEVENSEMELVDEDQNSAG